jgi:hypothetical protein
LRSNVLPKSDDVEEIRKSPEAVENAEQFRNEPKVVIPLSFLFFVEPEGFQVLVPAEGETPEPTSSLTTPNQ